MSEQQISHPVFGRYTPEQMCECNHPRKYHNHMGLSENLIIGTNCNACQCHEFQPVTKGSLSHEAEALLKGQPHEAEEANTSASRGSTAEVPDVQGTASGAQLGDCAAQSGLQASEVGGSDTARLQQIRERQHEVTSWHAHADRDWMLKHIDVQAIAIRTVREERDHWYTRHATSQSMWHASLDEIASLRADVARLTAERDMFKDRYEDYENREAACCPEDFGFEEVIASRTKRAEHAEQQAHALQEGIEQLVEKWQQEATAYITGSMLPSPVGDMNLASADVVRKILQDIRATLHAAIKET